MTRNEMISKIENGSDIMFDVKGRHFTILTWLPEGIGIDEQHPHDGNTQYFDTAEDLIDQYTIDGKSLSELAKEIVITDYT